MGICLSIRKKDEEGHIFKRKKSRLSKISIAYSPLLETEETDEEDGRYGTDEDDMEDNKGDMEIQSDGGLKWKNSRWSKISVATGAQTETEEIDEEDDQEEDIESLLFDVGLL